MDLRARGLVATHNLRSNMMSRMHDRRFKDRAGVKGALEALVCMARALMGLKCWRTVTGDKSESTKDVVRCTVSMDIWSKSFLVLNVHILG